MFLSLQGISKRFGSVVAVDSVSLEIAEGELVFFLGPSGCGKTTLLRLVAGLEQVDTGRILLRGEDLSVVPARLRNFGMVFQSYSLFPHMSVLRNVTYGPECHGWSRQRREQRAQELLAQMHLADQARKLPNQLSGGQQQRVALARALASDPLMLLLDEPLSALDAKVRTQLRGEIRELQKRVGITTIMVTHDQIEAMEMADRIVVMNRGRIEQVGSATELYYRPANRFVAEFLGHINLLRTAAGSGGSPLLAGRALVLGGTPRRGAVLVGIRPEAVQVLAEGDERENCFPARLVKLLFLGNLTRLELELAGQPLAAEVPYRSAEGLQPGRSVRVRLPAEDLVVYGEG
jgi:ABC-type Fe3+/spermidine/putrescine transport system ATPase subunit